MNCKKDDLAWIVRSGAGNHGRIVEVLGPVREGMDGDLAYPHEGPLWACRSERPLLCNVGLPMVEFAFPDAWLRPIRNPGEDAKDETLSWKPVPVEGVTA